MRKSEEKKKLDKAPITELAYNAYDYSKSEQFNVYIILFMV